MPMSIYTSSAVRSSVRFLFVFCVWWVSAPERAVAEDERLFHCKGDLEGPSVFSPDGHWLVSGGYERKSPIGTVHVWDARTRKLVSTLKPHPLTTAAVEFSRDGRWLVTAGANRVFLVWSVHPKPTPKTGLLSLAGTYVHHALPPNNVNGGLGDVVAIAPSSREFASYAAIPQYTADPAARYSIKVWPMPDMALSPRSESQQIGVSRTESSGTRLPQSSGSSSPPASSKVPAGEALAAAGPQPRLTISFDARADALTYSPDGKTIVVGFGADEREPRALKIPEVHFFDAETGGLLRKWTLKDDDASQRCSLGLLEFSPDGVYLLVSCRPKPTVSLWHVESQRVVWSSKVDQGGCCAKFSPDGKVLAFSSNSYEVRLLRFPECEPVSVGLTAYPGTSLTFSPNGKSLLTSWRRDAIKEWNVEELLSQKRWGLEKKPGRKGDDAQPSIVP